jgi:hypothetical protein
MPKAVARAVRILRAVCIAIFQNDGDSFISVKC